MARVALTRNQAANRFMGLARVRRDQCRFSAGMKRGRCARKGCNSRLAIVRITFDFRDPTEIRVAGELVCVTCDRVWATVRPPDIRRHRDGQRVRLTLILPPEQEARTWARHGTVHRTGEDAAIIADANYADLLSAQEAWRGRNERLLDRKQRAVDKRKARVEAEMAEWRAKMAAVNASIDAREAAAKELGI